MTTVEPARRRGTASWATTVGKHRGDGSRRARAGTRAVAAKEARGTAHDDGPASIAGPHRGRERLGAIRRGGDPAVAYLPRPAPARHRGLARRPRPYAG